MSDSALYDVVLASTNWQNAIQENQEVTATTINLASALLSTMNKTAQDQLDALMQDDTNSDDKKDNGKEYNPANGKPPSSWASSDYYSTDVQIWSTYYNNENQEWQNQENGVSTPIQAMNQQEQSLGNASQQASQTTSIVIGPGKNTATLLASPL